MDPQNKSNKTITRRDFLTTVAGALVTAAVPGIAYTQPKYRLDVYLDVIWLPKIHYDFSFNPTEVDETLDKAIFDLVAKGHYLAHNNFHFSAIFDPPFKRPLKREILTYQNEGKTFVNYHEQDETKKNNLGKLLMQGEKPLTLTPHSQGCGVHLSLHDLNVKNQSYVLHGNWNNSDLDLVWERRGFDPLELATIKGTLGPE